MICGMELVKAVPATAHERAPKKPMKVLLSKDRLTTFNFSPGFSTGGLVQSHAMFAETNTTLDDQNPHLQEAVLKQQSRLSLEQNQPCRSQFCDKPEHEALATASEYSTNASCAASPDQSDDEEDSMAKTTVVMKNLSPSCSRESIVELLNQHGFAGRYALVYVPVNFASMLSQCYAFVDFTSGDAALEFVALGAYTNGFCASTCVGEGGSEITWAMGMQGVHEAIEKYRNSPVMHALVPDQCKPLLFRKGQVVSFPKPTQKIEKPRGFKRKLLGA
jgi:hypothetical protein